MKHLVDSKFTVVLKSEVAFSARNGLTLVSAVHMVF